MLHRQTWATVLLCLCAIATVQVVEIPVAEAGNSDAVLTGVIHNPETDEVIEGAVVIVTGNRLQGERVMTTDETGLYRIPDLPPGLYDITVLYPNSKTQRRVNIQLRAGNTTRIDFRVETVESVTVLEVTSPPVDTASSSTGLSIDSEMARRVPIATPTGKGGANRSFESVAEATPGASSDLYGTSVAGTTSPENKYYIDGLSVNDPGFGLNGTALTVEFLEEVRVESGGYAPEFGRSTGGIVNAVTKTGSNEYHGGVWVFYSPGQLEGYRKALVREGETIQAEQKLLWLGDAGFDIGGRLVRDKLWFYAGVSLARSNYDIQTSWNRLVLDQDTGVALTDAATGFNVTEQIPGTEAHRTSQGTTIQALTKLTYAPAENHTIELLGIYAPMRSGGRKTYGIDARTGIPDYRLVDNATSVLGTFDTLAKRYRDDAAALLLEWNARADDNRWDITTVVGWHHQINSGLPIDGSKIGTNEGLAGTPASLYQRGPNYHSVTEFLDLPAGAADDACDPWVDPMDASNRKSVCPVTNFQLGGSGRVYEREFNRLQFRSMASRLATGAGHHLIKFGLDFEYMQYDTERGFTGGTIYQEALSGSYFVDYRRFGFLTGPDEASIVPTLKWHLFSTTIGGFVQDSWSIMDKVTVNGGLRYDAQHLFGGDGRLSMALPNQISPRVGLIWDPSQRGKAKIFTNYARFYQSVPLNLADRAGSAEPHARRRYDPSLCDPTNPDSDASGCQSDASRLPFTDPPDGESSDPAANAHYWSHDRYWSQNGAGKTAIDPALKPPSSDEIVVGGEYELIPGGKIGLTYTHRWINRVMEDMSRDEAKTYFIGNPGYGIGKDFPKGRRVYDAVILSFDKRFSQNWLLSASYTLSWLRGNIDGLYRPETGQLDPNISSEFDLVSLLDNRMGPLAADQRHSFKVFSSGDIKLGGGHVLMLGGAFRAGSGAPTNVLGAHERYGGGEAFLLPRGSGERLPWMFRIDTSIGYRKHFTEDLSMDFTMDVFNVANFQAVTAVDEEYTSSSVIPIEGATFEDLETQTDINGDPIVKNPNFGNPTYYQSPRLFRFGMRLNF